MKPTRKSVDLSNCASLECADNAVAPWRSDILSDDRELAFLEVTAGLPQSVTEELRGWSEFAAMAQLTGHFDGICDRLAGLPIAKKLMRVLQRIGPNGQERLSREGVSAADLIHAMTLLLPIRPEEREDIVSASVRYGFEAARAELARIGGAMRDPVFRRVIGLSDESPASIAKRSGLSAAAVCTREKRMKAKLHGKR